MNPGKAFRTLLLYRIGATLSYQITMVAVGWHLYEITNSVVSLGLIGLAELVPYFALALYSGHAVDHYSRKWIAWSFLFFYHFAFAHVPGKDFKFDRAIFHGAAIKFVKANKGVCSLFSFWILSRFFEIQ